MTEPIKAGLLAETDSRPDDTAGAISPRTDPWWPVIICVLLALTVWVAFGQTINHDFINFDDDLTVYGNPVIAQGFSVKGIVCVFTHGYAYNWNPLTSLSQMLDCQFYGLKPAGHHLTNVLLHAANAILLFLVLRNMTGALWASAFVAAVFALHPLRVESVAWVTERKGLLSGLFFFLTIGAYVRYARRPFALGRYLLVPLLFALGLLSKSMLVTLPFVLLLLDYWPLGRIAPGPRLTGLDPLLFRRLIIEKLPLLLLVAASCLATIWAQQVAINSVQGLGFAARIENAVVSYTAYLGQMIYPVGLAVLYPHPRGQLPVWTVGLSVLVLLIISAGVLIGRRSKPYLLVGWLWYLGMSVPIIGLMQAGSQARADRYTYLPQIGLYLMLTWGVVELVARCPWHRLLLRTFAALAIVTMLLMSRAQTAHWRNSISLWTHSLDCTPGSFLAHYHLGRALVGEGRMADGIGHFEQALQFEPNLAEVHVELGIALAQTGNLPKASQCFAKAVELKPDYPEAYNNLGLALASQGRLPEAIPYYERSLRLKPDNAEGHANLGNALAAQGQLSQAIQHYEQALQLKPDYTDVHHNLGSALANQGKLKEAILHYTRTLELKPDFLEAHYNLANVLTAQGNSIEAHRHYEQALNLARAVGRNDLAQVLSQKLKFSQPPSAQPAP